MDSETARKDLLKIKEHIAAITKQSTEANWLLKQPDRNMFGQEVAHLVRVMEDTVSRFRQAFEKPPANAKQTAIALKLRRLKLQYVKSLKESETMQELGTPDQPDLKDTFSKLRAAVSDLEDLNAKYPEPRMAVITSPHPLYGEFTLPEWIFYLKRLAQYTVDRLEHIIRFSPYGG